MVKQSTLIAAAGLLAYGAWLLLQDARQAAEGDTGDQGDSGPDWLAAPDEILTGATESAAEFLDGITGGILRVSAMARVNHSDLQNRNVRALLQVIRAGEGTSDANGYRRIFGGQLFESFADHPRVTVKSSGYTSTAAGAYQFIVSSWDETKRIMNLPDFSPASQDLAALGRIVARGALEDAKAGRFEAAVRKIAKEWASLPGSPYGQPTISWDKARAIFAQSGGAESNTAFA
jgi:muramidase (phage lysozyme)